MERRPCSASWTDPPCEVRAQQVQPVLLVHNVEAIDFEVWRAVGHGTGWYHGVISRKFTITYYRALQIAVPLNGRDTEERQVRQETRRAHQLIKVRQRGIDGSGHIN